MPETQELVEHNFDEALLNAADDAYNANIDNQAEIRIARLAMLQGLSPEIAAGKEGYKIGQIIHSITREILSAQLKQPWNLDRGVPPAELSAVECLPFIPVMKLPTEFVKWRSRDDRVDGQLPYEWKTLDQNEARVREGVFPNRGGTWGTDKVLHYKPDGKMKPPPVTDAINYLVLPVSYEKKLPLCNFCIATFARTSVQAGKDLTTEINNNKMVYGVRRFERLFYLWTDNGTDGKHTWKEYRATGGPILAKFAPDLIKLAAGMAIYLSDKEYGKIRQEQLLNVAPIVAGDDAGDHGDSDANTVDSTSTPGTTADPFKPDGAAGAAENPF